MVCIFCVDNIFIGLVMRYRTLLAPCTSINFQTSRTITCNSKMLEKCMPSQDETAEVKSKISVTVKKFAQSDVYVLKAKKSADVMRNLNYQNRQMFGKIIKFSEPKVKSTRIKATVKRKDPYAHTNETIQFETTIPIMEKSESYSEELLQPQLLNTILDFPLLNLDTWVNKSVQLDKYINQANCLRKYLQSICGNEMPSVTKILDKTMPPERAAILERWKSQMIERMGKEAFEEYQKKMLSTGSSFHHNVYEFLSQLKEVEGLEISAENLGHWKSIQTVLQDIKDVEILEEKMYHPFLQYKGVVDCLAKYRGQFVAIEWKTSQKPKSTISSTYDYPLQLAAYIGALSFDPKWQYLIRNGLLVIAYEGGTPATVHLLDEDTMKVSWNKWLQRLKIFWEMQ